MPEEKHEPNETHHVRWVAVAAFLFVAVVLVLYYVSEQPADSWQPASTVRLDIKDETNEPVESQVPAELASGCDSNADCILDDCAGCFVPGSDVSAFRDVDCQDFGLYTCVCMNRICTEIHIEGLQPQPDTSAWRSYMDISGMFSFDIPADWSDPLLFNDADTSMLLYSPEGGSWKRLGFDTDYTGTCDGPDCYSLFIDVTEPSSESSVIGRAYTDSDRHISYTDTLTYPVVSYREANSCSSKTTVIFGPKNNFVISYRCTDQADELEKIVNAITESFTLTQE